MFYYEYIDENLKELKDFKGKVAVYPCGVNGERTIKVLKESYSIVPDYLIDNNRCLDDKSYISFEDFKKECLDEVTIIITVEKKILAQEMEESVKTIANNNCIINLCNNFDDYSVLHRERLKQALDIENLLPDLPARSVPTDSGKIKVRIVHSKYQTFNTIESICKAVNDDSQMDLLVILGWDQRRECEEQIVQRNYKYVKWPQYCAEDDHPDILVLSQPYDYTTQLPNIRQYAKLVVVANVLLIRNTEYMNDFWNVQRRSFQRFEPDYFLCDSLLYHDIKGTDDSCGEIVEMGNAKFDGIYNMLHSNSSLPEKWEKIADKKKVLWTTDHGVWDTHCSHETFDLFAKTMIDYFHNHKDMALIFRPHKDLFEELVKVGIWKISDINRFIDYLNQSDNMVFDDNETYETSYKFSDAIIADACCGITLSALPTLKPIAVCYRSFLDEPFHVELTSNYINVHSSAELTIFLDDQRAGEDRNLAQRIEASGKFVKNFDGLNGLRIKDFIKDKYLEKNKLKVDTGENK